MPTFTTIKLTGNLISDTFYDSLYAYAGDTTGVQADQFVEDALDAYREIIESVTGGTWRRAYSEVIVNVDTDLSEGWVDDILQQIEDLDLIPIFEKATS
jgi:hypothetical protein